MCHWKMEPQEYPELLRTSPGIPSQPAVMDPRTKPLAVAQPTVADGCQLPSNYPVTGSSTVPPCGLEHARLSSSYHFPSRFQNLTSHRPGSTALGEAVSAQNTWHLAASAHPWGQA